MNVAMPAPPTWLSRISTFAQGALAVGLILAMVECHNARQNNADLAIQQQHLTGVSQFQASGKDLDQAFADFNDVAARGAALEVSRAAVLKAIRVHASDTEVLRPLVGGASTDRYLNALLTLRVAVENTTDATGLGERLSAFSTLLVRRNALVEEARNKRA